MAKGRKDTGDLYEVFRKITARQSDVTPEAVPKEYTDQTEAEKPEVPRVEAEVIPKNRRCFLVSYNTAVITFVAFILVGALLYNTGYGHGRKSGIQQKSKNDIENIIQNPETSTIHEVQLSDEKGALNEEWTVEIYSITRDKMKELDERIKKRLDRKGYNTFIARSEDGEKYVLWVNKFPKDSTKAQTTFEEMKATKTVDGTRAFKDVRFVKFDESRIVK